MIAKCKNSNGFAPIAAIFIVLGILIAGGGTYLAKDKIFKPKIKEQQRVDQNYNSIPNQQFKQNEIVDTTDAVETAEATDKNEKQIGYVKKIYKKDAKYYLDIDYVQWLDDDDALRAIKEDGECPTDIYPDPSYCINNGFYIRNQNLAIRTFEVSPTASVSTTVSITNDGKINIYDGVFPEGKPTTIDLLIKAFNDKSNLMEGGSKLIELFNVEIDESGKIVRMDEQYRP